MDPLEYNFIKNRWFGFQVTEGESRNFFFIKIKTLSAIANGKIPCITGKVKFFSQ